MTINSDDPAYFGGYIGDNYLLVAREYSLSLEDIVQLARNSFKASFFASEEERKRHLNQLQSWFEKHKGLLV